MRVAILSLHLAAVPHLELRRACQGPPKAALTHLRSTGVPRRRFPPLSGCLAVTDEEDGDGQVLIRLQRSGVHCHSFLPLPSALSVMTAEGGNSQALIRLQRSMAHCRSLSPLPGSLDQVLLLLHRSTAHCRPSHSIRTVLVNATILAITLPQLNTALTRTLSHARALRTALEGTGEGALPTARLVVHLHHQNLTDISLAAIDTVGLSPTPVGVHLYHQATAVDLAIIVTAGVVRPEHGLGAILAVDIIAMLPLQAQLAQT